MPYLVMLTEDIFLLITVTTGGSEIRPSSKYPRRSIRLVHIGNDVARTTDMCGENPPDGFSLLSSQYRYGIIILNTQQARIMPAYCTSTSCDTSSEGERRANLVGALEAIIGLIHVGLHFPTFFCILFKLETIRYGFTIPKKSNCAMWYTPCAPSRSASCTYGTGLT